FGLISQRGQKRLLLLPRHDIDPFPATHLFTQLTAYTCFFLNLDSPQVLRTVIGRRRNTVEWTDINTHTAAVTVIRVNNGDRPLSSFEHMGDIAEGIEDGLIRANDPAGSTVNTECRFDKVGLFRITTNRLGGTAFLARTTAGAIFCDNGKGHLCSPFYSCISFKTSS